MKILVIIVGYLFFGYLTYLSLFVPAKADRELKKGNFLKAFNYYRISGNKRKMKVAAHFISNEFDKLEKKIISKRISRKELNRAIEYFPIVKVKYNIFLRLVELLFDRRDEVLISKLIDKISKPAWEDILKKDLRRLQNAE